MQVYDKHQIKIAKDTLKMSDSGAFIMGGMTKREAIVMLRENGMSYTAITNMLIKNGYTNQEIQKIFLDAIRNR